MLPSFSPREDKFLYNLNTHLAGGWYATDYVVEFDISYRNTLTVNLQRICDYSYRKYNETICIGFNHSTDMSDSMYIAGLINEKLLRKMQVQYDEPLDKIVNVLEGESANKLISTPKEKIKPKKEVTTKQNKILLLLK